MWKACADLLVYTSKVYICRKEMIPTNPLCYVDPNDAFEIQK